jgi:hypothetical protein
MPRDPEFSISKELELASSGSAALKREYDRIMGPAAEIIRELKKRDSVMEQIRSVMAIPSLKYLDTVPAMAVQAYERHLREMGGTYSVIKSLAKAARYQTAFQSSIGVELARQATLPHSVLANIEQINEATQSSRLLIV